MTKLPDSTAPIFADARPVAPCGEDARAQVIAAYGVDGPLDDGDLSAIAAFAARLCDTPIALVSLVEEERQRFLAVSQQVVADAIAVDDEQKLLHALGELSELCRRSPKAQAAAQRALGQHR